MNEEDKLEEEFTELKDGKTQTTNHKHYYQEGVTMNGLKEVICSCGAGMMIDPKVEVKNGEILWQKN